MENQIDMFCFRDSIIRMNLTFHKNEIKKQALGKFLYTVPVRFYPYFLFISLSIKRQTTKFF